MSYEPNDTELKQLVESWVAQWNEPDPERRRRLVREVWSADALHVLVNPPEAVRDGATRLGIVPPSLEVRGYDAFDARVGRAYEMFVAPGQYVFELAGEPVRQSGAAVSVNWVMRDLADGSVAGSGFDVFTFDDDARVRTDHQFVG